MVPEAGEVLSADYGRLHARARRLDAEGVEPDDPRRQELAAAIAASRARRTARGASVPPLAVDESLPIAREAERIVELIRAHPVIVVAGETGSGKTTQLPKLCLAAGRGIAGMIGCTQPRRIAARSVARRVAQELGTEVGRLVGFQVRFNDQVGPDTLVKFMTDGILLAETQSDGWLSRYDTIIVDEAHERSLNIDFLLGYLQRLVRRRRDLRFHAFAIALLLPKVQRLHGIRATGDFDDGRAIEVLRETLQVYRRRGHDHFQVRAQRQDALDIAEQEIDVEAALVRLIDDERVVLAQQGIPLHF